MYPSRETRVFQISKNITAEEIPIIVLYAYSNSIRDLESLVPQIMEALADIKRREVVHVYPPY